MSRITHDDIARDKRPIILGIFHEGDVRRPELIPDFMDPTLMLRKVDDPSDETEDYELPVLDEYDAEVLEVFKFLQFVLFWIVQQLRSTTTSLVFQKRFFACVKTIWMGCILRARDIPNFNASLSPFLQEIADTLGHESIRTQYESWKDFPRQVNEGKTYYKEQIRIRFGDDPDSNGYRLSVPTQRIMWGLCNYGMNAVYHLARITETTEKSRALKDKFFDEASVYINDYLLGHIDFELFSMLIDLSFRATSLAASSVHVLVEAEKEIRVDQIEDVLSSLHANTEENPQGTCSACLSEFEEEEDTCTTHCGHRFHTPCLRRSLSERKECPYCRDEVMMF